MSASSKKIGDTLRMVRDLDREWIAHPAGRDEPERSLPWMPFPVFDFIALTAEALPEASGEKFLDVGCGIGTKMLLADQIFGLDTFGIERVPEYARQARQLGLAVTTGDALTWDKYGEFDLIFLNLTFRDPGLQNQLEQKAWSDAKSGAVVIGVNLLGRPPESWWLGMEDMDLKRGIWSKP